MSERSTVLTCRFASAPGRIRTCATSLGGRYSTPTPASLSTLQSPIRCLQPPQVALVDESSFHEPLHDSDRSPSVMRQSRTPVPMAAPPRETFRLTAGRLARRREGGRLSGDKRRDRSRCVDLLRAG